MFGIVVGHRDLGEADRLVRFLTPEFGRLAAVARGARRSKKRFSGALQPGTELELDLRQGRGSLPTLQGCTIVRAPRRVRDDVERIALMLYGCQLCSELAPEGGEARKLTRLLSTWLDLLDGEAKPSVASRIALEAKALTFSGFTPALLHCAACGEVISDKPLFESGAGGALHPWCGTGRSVDLDVLVNIERLRRTPLSETPTMSWQGPAWLVGDFVRYQLGHALSARDLLDDPLTRGPEP